MHRDWFLLWLTVGLVAVVGTGIVIAGWRDRVRQLLDDHDRDERARHLDAVITQALNDEAEYLCHQTCGFPPCDPEDGWLCFRHQPRPPLRYSPVPPSVHDISSLSEWK